MKQKITRDQFNELSEKGKDRLIKWTDKKEYLAPHLTIGQMIEFLEKPRRKRNWGIYFGKNLAFIVLNNGILSGKTPQNRKGKLCDGLWKACKEILDKEVK